MRDHVAWLLEEDGSVAVVYDVRSFGWPGRAKVVLADGSTKIVNKLNVLARDDLDRRFFDRAA